MCPQGHVSRAKAPGNPSLSPRERRPGLYRERVPFRKVRGQGRCHPSTLSPSSSSCHKMELRSHISLPTHRGARIEPRPTALGRVPVLCLGPLQWHLLARLQCAGPGSRTPSPAVLHLCHSIPSARQLPSEAPGGEPLGLPPGPRPPTPREQPEMQKQNSLSAQFYELQIHTGRATAASLAGPGPPRAAEGGSSPHGPPEVTPRSSPPREGKPHFRSPCHPALHRLKSPALVPSSRVAKAQCLGSAPPRPRGHRAPRCQRAGGQSPLRPQPPPRRRPRPRCLGWVGRPWGGAGNSRWPQP